MTPKGTRQRNFLAPWLELSLPMAVSKPLPVTLAAGSHMVHMCQGFEYPITYKANVRAGAKASGKINNSISARMGNIRIIKGADEGKGIFLNTNFFTPIATFDMLLETQTEVDGRPVSIYAPAIEIEVVAGFQVKLATTQLKLAPGGKTQLSGTIWRDFTFEGSTVKIGTADLPDNVTCAPVEIAADQTAFTLSCEASAQAIAGNYDIRLTGLAPETGRKAKADYKIQDIDAKLAIVGSAQAAR